MPGGDSRGLPRGPYGHTDQGSRQSRKLYTWIKFEPENSLLSGLFKSQPLVLRTILEAFK